MKSVLNIVIIIFLVLVVSCKNLLEQEPVSSLTQDNFWTSSSDAAAGVTAVYDGLQSFLSTNFLYWSDLRSDQIEFVQGQSNPTPNQLQIMNNELHARMGESNWTSAYVLIARCNNLITNISGITDMTESEKKLAIAHGKFIRALAYFYAVRIWGDVPLILQPYTSAQDNFLVSRTPSDQVIDAILQDVNEAINGLPVSVSKSRASWGAAMALKAHVLAWIHDYSGVQSVLDELFSGSLYRLVPGERYGEIFEQENSSESIFELQYSFSNYNETNGIADLFMAQPFALGLSPRYQPSKKLLAMFEEGDLRRRFLFFTESTGTSPQLIMKYFGSDNNNPANQFRIADDNVIIFRLADLYLLKAEAHSELGDREEAIELLNKIRNRVGLKDLETSSTIDLKEEILVERFRELCFEGHRFFDLVRNKAVTSHIKTIKNEGQLVWPIHEDRLIENPNLHQNEYYK